MEYIKDNISKKINWNNSYKDKLTEQFNNIYEIIKKELEIKDGYLEFTPKKIDEKKEDTKFKERK